MARYQVLEIGQAVLETIRGFTAAPLGVRCSSDIRLRDGSGAQCMRRAVVGGRCRQHHKIHLLALERAAAEGYERNDGHTVTIED